MPEIIPLEPDPGNTGGGRSKCITSHLKINTIHLIVIFKIRFILF